MSFKVKIWIHVQISIFIITGLGYRWGPATANSSDELESIEQQSGREFSTGSFWFGGSTNETPNPEDPDAIINFSQYMHSDDGEWKKSDVI